MTTSDGRRALVVGAGIFGVTAALELRARGLDVTLLDPGPLPHPLAESTDISKVVRLDYGADEAAMALMETALEGWRRWNAGWATPLFHERGVAFLTRSPMKLDAPAQAPATGSFEEESYRALLRRGHAPERLDAAEIHARFPAWRAGAFVDGYFNPEGGWAESGAVVAALAREAESRGVRLARGLTCARLLERGARVAGIVTRDGVALEADHVVVAAGTWTPRLLPHLAGALRSVGQPVFHLAPRDPSLFEASRFPVFGADIAKTGYYGFPVQRDGIVKIANHGVGRDVDPGDVGCGDASVGAAERVVSAAEVEALRAFLRDTFPALVDAPIVGTRLCVYGDMWDEQFLIARDPDRDGLTVAAGGSGHAFKFAPVLGGLISDATLGVESPALARFAWRLAPAPSPGEAARHHG
ncbi:MAG TPA: FAD-dependent oxidoreductase [Polyangiaceae bacterium]|nr:FAD-dependent oxidoreductase [Polyangiaceae bacterium]